MSLVTHDCIWQDKEIRFDITNKELLCKNGEFIIYVLQLIEDVKGNNGDKGFYFYVFYN